MKPQPSQSGNAALASAFASLARAPSFLGGRLDNGGCTIVFGAAGLATPVGVMLILALALCDVGAIREREPRGVP